MQLRIRKTLLVEAFKGNNLFNQDQMQAYLINVSGTLDRREPLADISRHYNLSMFVTTLEVKEKPLDDIPPNIQKLIQKESQALTVTETSTRQPIPRRFSENIVTKLLQFEPAQQTSIAGSSEELTETSPPSVATTCSLLTSKRISSVPVLPLKKRQQDADSLSSSSFSQQIKYTLTQTNSPITSHPRSSSPVYEHVFNGKGIAADAESVETSSSIVPKKRSPSIDDEISSSKAQKCSTSTSQKQCYARQNEADDGQDKAKRPVRRSARIKEKPIIPTKYSK